MVLEAQEATPPQAACRTAEVTWEEWFEKKFGEPLDAYAARMAGQKRQKG
jgi:hypothetical protein